MVVDEKTYDDIVMLMRLAGLTNEERFVAEKILREGDEQLVEKLRNMLLSTIDRLEKKYLDYANDPSNMVDIGEKIKKFVST